MYDTNLINMLILSNFGLLGFYFIATLSLYLLKLKGGDDE